MFHYQYWYQYMKPCWCWSSSIYSWHDMTLSVSILTSSSSRVRREWRSRLLFPKREPPFIPRRRKRSVFSWISNPIEVLLAPHQSLSLYFQISFFSLYSERMCIFFFFSSFFFSLLLPFSFWEIQTKNILKNKIKLEIIIKIIIIVFGISIDSIC